MHDHQLNRWILGAVKGWWHPRKNVAQPRSHGVRHHT